MIPAVVFCSLMLIGAITLIFVMAERMDEARHPYEPRHAPRSQPAATQDAPPAMPKGRPSYRPADFRPDWWDERAPRPPAVEILTGPGAPIRHTSQLTIGTLARVRDAIRNLDKPARRLDDTAPIPHAVGTWGKTPAQITDELAAKYLAAPR